MNNSQGSRKLPHAADVYSANAVAMFKATGLWKDAVLTDFLTEHAQKRPNETAIVFEGSSTTWSDLAESVDRLAAGFIKLGLRPGDFVAMQLPNCTEFVQTYLAIQRAGLHALTMLTIYREHDVRFMLGKCGAKAYVVPNSYRSFDFASMAGRIAAEDNGPEQVIVLGEPVSGTTSFADLARTTALPAEEYARLRPDPDGVSKISFTSGTTGTPKGVVHTHNTDLVPPSFLVEVAELDHTTPIWMPSPIAHVTGLLFGPYTALMTGAKLILQDVWDPVVALGLIEKERPKVTVSATPFIAGMLDVPNRADYDLSSFTHFMSGGAQIPSALVERAKAELGINLLRVFGSAEAPLHTANSATDPWDKVVGRDGRPFGSVSCKVVDPDDRTRTLPTGELGEYATWGPHVFLEYLDEPERTAEARDAEGWYYSGDLCRIDEDGYMLYVDRIKDIINRGGIKISAAEVEGYVASHPAVHAVAVVAVPDERLGERTCAFVIPEVDRTVTLAELREHLQMLGVTTQKWPEILRLVGAFPITMTGKVRKIELRDQFLAEERTRQ